MKLLFLDHQTKQALHMIRIIRKNFNWKIDVYSPGKPLNNLCYYSKYINNFFQAPKILKEKYLIELTSVLKKNYYDEILCFSDDIIYLISEKREEIKKYVGKNLLIPRKESIRLAINKNQLCSLAKDLEIPVPKQIVPNSLDELKRKSNWFDYPVVVKGERGAGACNVRFAKNDRELYEFYLEILNVEKNYNGKPSIQDFIKGKGFLGHVLCYDGELLRFCIHEKIVQYPPRGGLTTVGRTVFIKDLLSYTQKIFEKLRWNGLANIDFFYDEINDKFYFLEINPRISGSIIVTHFAGTEMIENFCKLIQGDKVQKSLSYKENVTVRFLFPREIQYLIRNLSYLRQFVRGFFLKNTFTDLDPFDVKPIFGEMGDTLKKINKEFILKKGRYEEIRNQQELSIFNNRKI